MKTINSNLAAKIQEGILECLRSYEVSNEGNLLSDLYLFLDTQTTTLKIFDDLEQQLANVDISGLTTQEDIETEVIDTAKALLKTLQEDDAFDSSFINKPFFISLVDENFSTKEELIFIDDDTIQLGNDIWDALDKDLNDFFDDLMN
ncbi:hypothetical protein M2138_002074 [Dysgonomonadaceae bacterium PH5-43]|nr:hypothetical protein [Dysgonomonadaceae bacterium PH5-43]